ncbi:hypothetical protein ACH4B8_31300 [Streptomyces flaveolus]|uniref:hypothetical protein n=1 Tax=Streptomyces flaveolus TaxID=67297 RepID=UPI0037A9234F
MIDSSREGMVGGGVTLGLSAAGVLHDVEELAGVPCWWRRNLPALCERYPARAGGGAAAGPCRSSRGSSRSRWGRWP